MHMVLVFLTKVNKVSGTRRREEGGEVKKGRSREGGKRERRKEEWRKGMMLGGRQVVT